MTGTGLLLSVSLGEDKLGYLFGALKTTFTPVTIEDPRNAFALNHAEKCKIVSTILKQDCYYKRFPFCLLVSDKLGVSLSGLESDISKMHPH